MNTSNSSNSQKSLPPDTGFSPWQRLKSKRISYLTLPLLMMATVTEFVILATGWKYQQVVCLPPGMRVTFFHIGPIGATILAVELLKLPLAIWTASRHGLQKLLMLTVGLPLICVLTFQLVKDMAVYEMGVAMTPAAQFLEKAMIEETKATQLTGELTAIEQKKADREGKLAELAAQQAKAKADLEDSLKRNDDARTDAISLTDYQKKELSAVESREEAIIQQFNADTAQLSQSLTDLRARRETELARAGKWNAEEARIDNDYKARMTDYQNKKAAYEKESAAYAKANVIKRQLMTKPVDPGVAPELESNTILKPTVLAEIEDQIKAKEAELAGVNNKRRERVAQVEAEAHQLREDFDHRSSSKRETADRKREELLAAQAVLATEWKAQEKQIDGELATSVQKVDGIRAEIDQSRKAANGFYEAREAAIRNTQVHRIATTVEIVRGLIMGERPASIKATAKERGDILTDQISMVRIWVYPVLAFIVAFLPTLMVEIGFSTLFEAEKERPLHRLGFFGRRLHQVCLRAGRQKMLRAERFVGEASAKIYAHEKALAAATSAADKALKEKESELTAAREAINAAAAAHEEQLKTMEEARVAQLKDKEDEWVAKLASMADMLNRTVVEKDALRDLQKSEVERQIQMRQNAWSDRITQLSQELDDQRVASETERTALMQAQQKKLLEVSEDCKAQVYQARRQAADAELAAMETSAKSTHELKEALQARDCAESQLKQQADTFSLRTSQTREEAAREMEKAVRQEKHRVDRQQLEFAKTLRQREDDFERQLKQREQELSLAFDARLAEEQTRNEQDGHRREAEMERRLEARALEVDARWKKEEQQREEAVQEWKAQTESRCRATETRLQQEAQQKEELFLSKARQRDQQWQMKLDAALAETQTQTEEVLHRRQAEADARLHELEAQLRKEMQQKDEAAQARARQREQELQTQFAAQIEARHRAAQALLEKEFGMKMRAAVEPLTAQLARAEKERDEAKEASSESVRQLQNLEKKLTEASVFLSGWRNGNGNGNGNGHKNEDHVVAMA
jgi:hypothetical protein